jgi:hypothetical protein
MVKMKINMNITQEHSDYSDNEDSYISDKNASLTINELKSRLNQMNVELDLSPHPKKFFLEKYNQAINDPAKRELIKKYLEEDKNKNSKHQKKSGDFTKNKRKRSEEGKSQNLEDNMTSIVDNINDIKENPSIKTMKLNLTPASQSPEGNKYKFTKSISSGCVFTPPRQSSEKKLITSNVKTHLVILSSGKKNDVLLNSEPQNEVRLNVEMPCQGSGSQNNVIISNNAPSSGPNLKIEMPATSPRGGVNIDYEAPVEPPKPIVRRNSAINVINSSSCINKDINLQIKRFKSGEINQVDMPILIQRSDSRPRSPSPINSSNIQRQVSQSQKSFKSPSQSQVFLNEIQIATTPRRSSQNLNNRTLIVNSINSTQLPNQSGQQIIINRPIDRHNLLNKSSISMDTFSVNEKVKIFILGFGSAVFLKSIYLLLQNIPNDYNPILNLIRNNSDLKKQTVGLLFLAALGVIAFLIHKNNQTHQRANKIIAENSVQEIRDHLLNRDRDNEIYEVDFTENYCRHNRESVEKFRNNILPHIKSMIKMDEILEEAYVIRENTQRCVWRLKNSQL